jgi:hypothetical protein
MTEFMCYGKEYDVSRCSRCEMYVLLEQCTTTMGFQETELENHGFSTLNFDNHTIKHACR